jgi:hypothetical protein
LNPRTFSLVPFRGEEDLPDLAITGTIGRSADTFSIACAIAGNLSVLAVPAAAESPERRGRLWEETCLELFVGAKGSDGYWEFNLSPAGHWNVYRFASYRDGMREETAFPSLPFRIRAEPDALRFSLDLEPGKILPPGEAVEAGVCAVLRTTAGGTSHWALDHPGPRPDFHRRDGFALTIPFPTSRRRRNPYRRSPSRR